MIQHSTFTARQPPRTRQFHPVSFYGFYLNDVMEDLRYKRAEENVGKGTFSGTADGKSFSANLTVTFSENRIVHETDGMKRGAEPSPDLAVTFTRNRN